MQVDDEIAFLDQPRNPDLQDWEGSRHQWSLQLPLSIGGVWSRLAQPTVASITGCDRYGRMVPNLLNTSIEGRSAMCITKAVNVKEIGRY